MSPRAFVKAAAGTVLPTVNRLWVVLGIQIRDARVARRWSVATLADKAGVSRSAVYLLEAGGSATLETPVRVAAALGLRLQVQLTDPRRRGEHPTRPADLVHSAMGEFEAGHLGALKFPVGIDEPYQHYQFAGRADVVAWDLESRSLLHIENRTRFPDLQESAGSFNAKRAYLGAALGERLGVRRWSSQTHVMAALWSAEVLHSLRLRPESFRSLCPDPADAFSAWWAGEPPESGITSALIVLDPLAARRQRPYIGLADALDGARPRQRGYADFALCMNSVAGGGFPETE